MALPGMIIADVEQWEPSALLCENKHEKDTQRAYANLLIGIWSSLWSWDVSKISLQ